MRATEGLKGGFKGMGGWVGLQKLITVLGRFDTYKGRVSGVCGMGGLITSFNIYISHVKKIYIEKQNIMTGLRSPDNFF